MRATQTTLRGDDPRLERLVLAINGLFPDPQQALDALVLSTAAMMSAHRLTVDEATGHLLRITRLLDRSLES